MIYKEIYFGRKQEKARVDVTQNSNAQTLVFRSMDWDIPSESSVNIFVNKPDGHLIYNAGSVSGNEMSFTMTTQMTAVPGFAECQVQVSTSDEKILNSFVFDMVIEETIIDGTALESTDEYTALEGLITDATVAISNANDAADDARAAAGEAREPVQVGARNLVINTLNPSSSAKPKLKGASDAVLSGLTATYSADGLDLTAGSSGGTYKLAEVSTADLYCFEPGEYYVLRCKAAGSGDVALRIRLYSGGSWAGTAEHKNATVDGVEIVFKKQLGSAVSGAYVEIELSANASVRITDLQVEKATVPSQYRPATEDITTPLMAAQSQLNNLILTESKSITTTSNYYILSKKTGYELAAAYRNDDGSSGYLTAINRRTNGDYTLLFNVSSATSMSIFLVWAKVG